MEAYTTFIISKLKQLLGFTPRNGQSDLQPSATLQPENSRFESKSHPLIHEVSNEVNDYFLKHWPFPDPRSRKRFVAAGFPDVTCMYYPLAKDDRIEDACRLITFLFLIDDELEHMSFEDGEAYNTKLMSMARGEAVPDRTVPAEYIMYDLWESMRQVDEKSANRILQPMFEFMKAQTDRARAKPMELGKYFQYRERDVGRGLLSALMCFCMGVSLTKDEAKLTRDVDTTFSKHLSVINDIWSFEKEVAAAKIAHEEGGVLCTSVSILAEEAGISAMSAKRTLYFLCREWELQYEDLTAAALRKCDSSQLRAYFKGLEYQMSANEVWSRTTPRYHK